VRLGLTSADELRAACREIAERAVAAGAAPDVDAVGFLVTELAFGPEVLVGALRDPVAGPTVTVAVGGWAAEAGATLGTIVGAREETAIAELARRWDAPRLLGEARTRDLVTFLARLADAFAGGPLAGFDTVEINPLLLTAGGPVIADALMVRAAS
jgi:acetate---CoA ligase (ADP-forming)